MSAPAGGDKNEAPRKRNLKEEEIEAALRRIREEKARLLSEPPKTVILPATSASSSSQATQYEPTDFLKDDYRFIRSEKDDLEAETSWEKNLAKQYHESLYKEYALADLSRYKEGKVCQS